METFIAYLFLLGRILYGGFFIKSGLNHFSNNEMLANYAASKGVPMPKTAVYLTGVMMFLAGLYIVLGLLVSWGVLFLVVALSGITFKMHAFWKDNDPQARMMNEINFWKNVALIGGALMILNSVSSLAPHWKFALNWWM
ncbi:MAG: DoxX family protein [Candidatus Vogelbacteria bacterium]|nr:DoxX family protein [Candidatus Vogelbacteria bacterium]